MDIYLLEKGQCECDSYKLGKFLVNNEPLSLLVDLGFPQRTNGLSLTVTTNT